MELRTILGILSVLIGAIAYSTYIIQTLRKGEVRPHPFSWLLWGFVTLVAFLVQYDQGGKAGSWVTGFTAAACFVIGFMTMLKHDWKFTWFDWLSAAASIPVLCFYIFSRSPTYSAIFATAADVFGYGPTIKKGWKDPWADSVTSFSLNSLKFVIALPAIGIYSIATTVYPVTIAIVNGAVAIMLKSKRRRIPPLTTPKEAAADLSTARNTSRRQRSR